MTAKAELANCTRCSMQLTPGEPYVLLCHPARRVPASGRPREAYPDGRQGLPAVRIAWLHDGRACALACFVLACAYASMRVRVRGLLAAWRVRKRQQCVRARVQMSRMLNRRFGALHALRHGGTAACGDACCAYAPPAVRRLWHGPLPAGFRQNGLRCIISGCCIWHIVGRHETGWHRLAAGVPPGHHREAVRHRPRLGTHTRCPSRFALSRFALSRFALSRFALSRFALSRFTLSRLASRVLSLRPSSSPHWTIGELVLGSSTQGSHTHAQIVKRPIIPSCVHALTTCTHAHTAPTPLAAAGQQPRQPPLCSCAAYRCALAFAPCRTWRRALKCA
jgi:hypothetical protein